MKNFMLCIFTTTKKILKERAEKFRVMRCKNNPTHFCWLWRWKRKPQAMEWKQPPKVEKGKETDSCLGLQERNITCQHLNCSQVGPVLDFWPTELKDNKFAFLNCYVSSYCAIFSALPSQSLGPGTFTYIWKPGVNTSLGPLFLIRKKKKTFPLFWIHNELTGNTSLCALHGTWPTWPLFMSFAKRE